MHVRLRGCGCGCRQTDRPDRHQGPTVDQTSRLLVGCRSLTPQPWPNFELELGSWEPGPRAPCFLRRPSSTSKAQLCLSLPRPPWERVLGVGPHASSGTQPRCTAWEAWAPGVHAGAPCRERALHLPYLLELYITTVQALSAPACRAL